MFYQCYGGAHTSVTCASIHMGYLPTDRIPTANEFVEVPFYDKMDNSRLGTPIYIGRDELGWDIYIIGLKNARDIIIPTIKDYLALHSVPQETVLFVNALVELHPVTSVGGFASRKLHLVTLGKPMTIWGIRRSYPKFVDLVTRVREMLTRVTDLP